jgi:hypothetical protein
MKVCQPFHSVRNVILLTNQNQFAQQILVHACHTEFGPDRAYSIGENEPGTNVPF